MKLFFLNIFYGVTSLFKKKGQMISTGQYYEHLKTVPKNQLIRLLVKRTSQYETLKNDIRKLGLQSKFDRAKYGL